MGERIVINPDFKGYLIEYNPTEKKFYGVKETPDKHFEGVKNREDVIEDTTQAAVEDYLTKVAKKGFQRIKAVHLGYNNVTVGEITSAKKEIQRYNEVRYDVWFAWKEPDGTRRKEKFGMGGYSTGGNFIEATSEALETAKEISTMIDKYTTLGEQIKQAIEQAKAKGSSINATNIMKLAGLA